MHLNCLTSTFSSILLYQDCTLVVLIQNLCFHHEFHILALPWKAWPITSWFTHHQCPPILELCALGIQFLFSRFWYIAPFLMVITAAVWLLQSTCIASAAPTYHFTMFHLFVLNPLVPFRKLINYTSFSQSCGSCSFTPPPPPPGSTHICNCCIFTSGLACLARNKPCAAVVWNISAFFLLNITLLIKEIFSCWRGYGFILLEVYRKWFQHFFHIVSHINLEFLLLWKIQWHSKIWCTFTFHFCQ